MKLQIKINHTDKQASRFTETLSGLLTSAIEGGGIRYWCDIVQYAYGDKATRWTAKVRLSDEFKDDEDKRIRNLRKYLITEKTILRGLLRLASGRIKVHADYLRGALSVLVTGEHDYDADFADVVVQAGLFNDVLFG